MTRNFKALMLIWAGVTWLMFAAFFAFFVYHYLSDGAGIRLFGLVRISSFSVVLGWIHLLGFTCGVVFCLAIGLIMSSRGCAYLATPAARDPNNKALATTGEHVAKP